jgi:hypothetical protein
MKTDNILETYLMPNGLEIDMDEGFVRLTERQFGGNPGRAFNELIQNAIDSYPKNTSWDERMVEIETGDQWIAIRDYGEGMSTERLRLLITLGGTDKYNDPEKIGQFGMGFMAMFNPRLGTKVIKVITRCEGHTVQLVFTVNQAGKRPSVSLTVLHETINFSTCISAEFDNVQSVKNCIDHAHSVLNYYPCKIKINGILFVSQWERSFANNSLSFSESGCHGLIKFGSEWNNMALLCKYECIMVTTLHHFITGGHNVHYNLLDYYNQRTPYIPGIEIILNADNLKLTISRDNYYLDLAYYQALALLTRKMKGFLLRMLSEEINIDLILANQFIFSREIATYLSDPDPIKNYPNDENSLIMLLANTPVYCINGQAGRFSINQLKRKKRKDFPFYYSPNRMNLRWIGGSFKHDYVVIPETCHLNSGADHFYDILFTNVFQDVVNLDTIKEDQKKIMNLVSRNIIDKATLSPEIKIIGTRHLNKQEKELLSEIDSLLQDPNILYVIEKNLHLKINELVPVFFSLQAAGLKISAGLFHENGKPVNEDFISNFMAQRDNEIERGSKGRSGVKLFLGLSLDHPFIRYLVSGNSSQRNYYALTYLAHELSLCQKMLVPYSPFYHVVKQKLALDMRMALTKNLLGCIRN